MPREKQTGICSVCGATKPLFDVKNKVCGSCAGKRGGGRPKAIKFVKPDAPGQKALAKIQEESRPRRGAEAPLPTGNGSGSGDGSEKYVCESCGKEVRYGQRKCNCGVWCDWRGTAVEQDSALLVCPECGAIAGHVGQAASCPHCNYGAV
jgi:hypothetical protein